MKKTLLFLIVLLMLIPIGCLGRRRKHKSNRRKELSNFRKAVKEIKSTLQEDPQINTANSAGHIGKDEQYKDGISGDKDGKAAKDPGESGKADGKASAAKVDGKSGKASIKKVKGQSGKASIQKLNGQSGKASIEMVKGQSWKASTGNVPRQSGQYHDDKGKAGTETANKAVIPAQTGQGGKADTLQQQGKPEQSDTKAHKEGGTAESSSDNRLKNVTVSGDGPNSTSSRNMTKFHPHLTEEEQARYAKEFRRHIQTKLQIDENMPSEEVPGDLLLPPPLQTAPEEMQSDQAAVQDSGFHAQPESFIWADDLSHECTQLVNFACLGFENLKSLKGRGRVYSSKLWFNGGFMVKRIVTIYSLKKVKSPTDKSIKIWRRHRFLGHVSLSEDKTFKDVTHIVQRWMEATRHYHGFGLVIRREKNSTLPVSILRPDLFSNKTRTPFLEIGISPIQSVIKNPLCTPDETRCCRNVVKIKAHDIFPQIIAPAEFEVTFCSGTCNDPVMDDISSNYTRYIRTYRWRTEDEVLQHGLTPCCAPIKFRNGSILLYKGGTITQYDIPEFMPTACGCI